MSIYNYYMIDCNRFEEKLCKQNKSNTGLKLKTIRPQFKNVFNYFKKKSCRIKQLEIVIDQLIVAKTKTDIVFPSVKILIDTS